MHDQRTRPRRTPLRRLALGALVAGITALAVAPAAGAATGKLSIVRAKAQAKKAIRSMAADIDNVEDWRVGACYRFTRRSVDCDYHMYSTSDSGYAITCDDVIRLTLRNGAVQISFIQDPECY